MSYNFDSTPKGTFFLKLVLQFTHADSGSLGHLTSLEAEEPLLESVSLEVPQGPLDRLFASSEQIGGKGSSSLL